MAKARSALSEGLVAGLIGAAAVAGWYLVLDLFYGRLLFTPAALGSAFFLGADDPASVQVGVGTVLGYTVLHLALFAVAGIIFAALVRQADAHPGWIVGLVVLFVTFETMAIGLIFLLAAWLVEVLQWWTITVANLIAAGAMGAYLWKRHPAISRGLDERERAPGA